MGIMFSDAYLENGIVIDCRSKDEWDYGHVEGAILIPSHQIGSKIQQYVKDKNAPINLYCASGGRSGSAKSTLLSMGYTNVANLGSLSAARSKIGKK
jgi:phage shock protein E